MLIIDRHQYGPVGCNLDPAIDASRGKRHARCIQSSDAL